MELPDRSDRFMSFSGELIFSRQSVGAPLAPYKDAEAKQRESKTNEKRAIGEGGR